METTHHAACDATEVVLIQAAVEEEDREEGCEEHLCPSHHLVDRGCHGEKADVHKDSGHQVESGGNSQQEDFPKLRVRLANLDSKSADM